MRDLDAALRLQALRQLADGVRRHDAVLVAVDHQAGRRAGREEREVIEVRRRGDADEALDLGAAHQQLHGDPGAERDAGDPAALGVRLDDLQPVERGSRVRQLARAAVPDALAAADAAEVEPQHRKAALHEGVIERVDDLIVHRPAELRVRDAGSARWGCRWRPRGDSGLRCGPQAH